jgi:hypothetical protein
VLGWHCTDFGHPELAIQGYLCELTTTTTHLLVQEKGMVMQEYLSLKEANKQLKEQAHHRPSLSLPFVFPDDALIIKISTT